MYVPFAGFAPDAEPTESGIFLDCDHMVPTLRGFEVWEAGASTGVSSAPSSVASAYAYVNLDGSARTIMGTEGSSSAATAQLYELGSGGWVDRGGAGSPYTASGRARWVFTNYGDTVLAAQKGAPILKSTGANSEFTAVSTAPHASLVISVLDFVLAFDIDDTETGNVYGNDPNRWWCCAVGNIDSWAPDVATQATTGLLTDGTGPIVAAARVGSSVVAFKHQTAYLGQYVGPPEVWGWTRIPGEGLGAYSHYSVVDVEGVGLLFPGHDNFYIFDGSRAVPIGTNRVAEFFLADLDASFSDRMIGIHSRHKWQVFWWYPSLAGALNDGTLDRYLVYNYRANKWGFGRATIKFGYEYLAPGVTWGDLGTYYTTWADLPNNTWGRAFLPSLSSVPGYFTAGGELRTMEGNPSASYYDTGYLGEDGSVLALIRARPRFRSLGTVTGSMDHKYVDQLGATVSTSVTGRAMTRGAFDHVWAARWHRLKHSYTGSLEVLGLDLEVQPDSME